MFTDATELPTGSVRRYDVAVVGSGPAGITVAQELAGAGRNVALLESGGLTFEEETQDLYDGVGVGAGQPYSLTESRLRFFGGTSNHWTGWCRPLDPEDLAGRLDLDVDAWPFGRDELDRFYPRAHEILELGAFDYAPPRGRDELGVGALETAVFRISPPVRFGVRDRARLRASDDIEVLLHANVTNIAMEANAARVAHVAVQTLGGRRFVVEAEAFVLATGGIENARLLLASDDVRRGGIGNEHDVVGRYFCEHPYLVARFPAVLLASGGGLEAYTQQSRVDGIATRSTLNLAPAIREREGLLNASLSIHTLRGVTEQDRELVDAVSRLATLDDRRNATAVSLMLGAEQEPRRENRVTLSTEVDALGMRRAQLSWALSDLDRHTIRRTLEVVATELGRAGRGRLRVPVPAASDVETWPWEGMRGGNHHMGATRMHESPRRGVVDANCRVHGTSNLYIAGSSVFPSVGHANPTLTIVALAVRLAAHLREGGLR